MISETSIDSPGISWGPDAPPPMNAPAVKPGKPVKPKKADKKLAKSAAAELKDAMERGQVGAPPPELKPAKPKSERRKLKPKSQQIDLVTDGKMLVPEPDSPLYKAGKRLAEAVEQVDLAVDEKAEALQEVIKSMKNAKRYTYKVAGYVFEFVHKGASDNVKVIKLK